MNKLTFTSAVFVAMAATSVWAHHPSEAMSPNFETVDAQLADTPHATMDIYEMGSTTATGSSDVATAARQQQGWVFETERTGVEPPVDTMILLEDID